MIGFMLDSARALDQRSYYTRFVDFIAERGCDTLLLHFSDDQGCSLRFDTFPECASANAYSHTQMRELVAYAKLRQVNIIPELASLGHTRYLTHSHERYADLAETNDWYSSICPVSPLTRSLIVQLLDEVLAVFESPIIHVGLDEVNLGGHPLTRQELQTRSVAEVFAEYVCFLHTHLTHRGRRMMMWGDFLVTNDEVLDRVPRDILIANWQYDPDVTADATRRLTDAGFEVVVCPALISHNQPALPGESFAYPNVRKMASHRAASDRAVGMLTTIWTPTRFLSDTLWPAVDYAAAIMRGEDASVTDRAQELGRTHFGIADPTTFAEAITRLTKLAPRRNRWLALIRLEPDATRDLTALDAELDACRVISGLLRACGRHVTQNIDAFERLVLLADLFEHIWDRAIAVRACAVSDRLVAQSRQLAERLASAWDRERFSDDPRKSRPVTAADEGDSLLFVFEQGTAALQKSASVCR